MVHHGVLSFDFEADTGKRDIDPLELLESLGGAIARAANGKSPLSGVRVKLTPKLPRAAKTAATIRSGYSWTALKRGVPPGAAKLAGRARDSVFTREQPYGGSMITPVVMPADDRGFDINAELDEIARLVEDEAGSRWASAIRRVKKE